MTYSSRELKNIKNSLRYWEISPEQKECMVNLIEQARKLSECESLLSEAQDLMSDVHCYDTEIYHEISKYFEEQ